MPDLLDDLWGDDPPPKNRDALDDLWGDDRSGLENFGRGVANQLAQTGYRAAKGAVWVGNKVLPGDPLAGAEKSLEEQAREAAELYDPQGKAGTAGQVLGALVGEGALLLAGGAGVASGITRGAAALGRGAQGAGAAARAAGAAAKVVQPAAAAIAAGRRGNFAQRAAANVLPAVPIDAALGAGGAGEGESRGKAAAVNVALGAAGGTLLEGAVSGARAAKRMTQDALDVTDGAVDAGAAGLRDALQEETEELGAALDNLPHERRAQRQRELERTFADVVEGRPADPAWWFEHGPEQKALPAGPKPAEPSDAGLAGPAIPLGAGRGARTGAGRRRPVDRVSTDGLVDELLDLEAKRLDAEYRAQYAWRQDENLHSTEDGRAVASADYRGGGGASRQAKAMQNLDDYNRIDTEIRDELRRRGHDDDAILEMVHEKQTIRNAQKRGETWVDNQPERVALRSQVRDQVAQQWLSSAPAGQVDQGRELVFVVGLPGAGKSTVAVPLAQQFRAAVADADDVKHLLPEFDGGRGSPLVHRESSDIAMAARTALMRDGRNLVWPTIASDPGEIARTIDRLAANGWRVHVRAVLVDPRLAAQRAAERTAKARSVGQAVHEVPEDVIMRLGERQAAYDALLRHPGVTSYGRFDNAGPEPRLLESGGDAPDLTGSGGRLAAGDLRGGGSGGLPGNAPVPGRGGAGGGPAGFRAGSATLGADDDVAAVAAEIGLTPAAMAELSPDDIAKIRAGKARERAATAPRPTPDPSRSGVVASGLAAPTSLREQLRAALTPRAKPRQAEMPDGAVSGAEDLADEAALERAGMQEEQQLVPRDEDMLRDPETGQPLFGMAAPIVGAGAGAVADDEDRLRGAGVGLTASVLPATVSRRGVRGFYSRLGRAIDATPFEKGTGAQWKAALSKNVAKGEREWTGIDAILDDQRDQVLTRQQVRDIFDLRRVELGETVLGGASHRWTPEPIGGGRWRVRRPSTGEILEASNARHAEAIARSRNQIDDPPRPGPSKFGAYTEPGGENYREILIQLETPQSGAQQRLGEAEARVKELAKAAGVARVDDFALDAARGDLTDEQTKYFSDELRVAIADLRNVYRLRNAMGGEGIFRSSHFDQPNILAHARVKDRTLPNGERVLFIEEIQSDWHQQGRQKGYQDREQARRIRAAVVALGIPWEKVSYDTIRRAGGSEALASEFTNTFIGKGGNEVPDAPYKKTDEWVGLTLRRLIDEAVTGGYDRIAWTTGAQQAARYDLSKHAGALSYDPKSGRLTVLSPNQMSSVHQGTYDPRALPSVIGKEATERLLASPTVQRAEGEFHHWLEGDDLRFGGFGMRTFYDEMLPKQIREYAKKLGMKVDIEPVAATGPGVQDIRAGLRAAADRADDEGDPIVREALDAILEDMRQGEPFEDAVEMAVDLARDEHGLLAAQRIRGAVSHLRESIPAEANLSFRITPELRNKVQTEGQYLYSNPVGPAADFLTKTPLRAALAGAVVGGAADEENRLRGAAQGAVIGAGVGGVRRGYLAIRAGKTAMRSASTPTYLNDPAVQAMRQTISVGARATQASPGIGERTRAAAAQIYTRLVDELYPLRRFGREVGGTEKVSHEASRANGWRGAAESRVRTDLKPVLALAKGHEDGVLALAKAERVIELAQSGKDTEASTLAAAQQTVATLSNVPEVRKAVDALRAYYRSLLDAKLANGVIDQEAYDAITASGQHYVPLLPEWVAERAAPSAGGGKLVNRGTGVRKMSDHQNTGSTVDPFAQAVLDTYETERTIAKQRVSNMLAAITEADPAKAAPFIRRLGPDEQARHGRIVEANINGRRQRFEVDQELHEAWASLDPKGQSLVVKLLAPFKRALQAGVTLMPDFAAANAIRDNVQSGVQYPVSIRSMLASALAGSGVGAAANDENRMEGALQGAGIGLGAGALSPNIVRTSRAMFDVVGRSDLYETWLREGGGGFGEFYGNPEDAQKAIARLRRDPNLAKTIINPKSWVGALQAIGRAVEEAPRVARFRALREAGEDAAAAAAGSRDISLDFATIGRDTKSIAATTAFFNAKLQGWSKLARMLKNPKTHAIAAATITAPSIALWSINKDNDEYWQRPQWERNLFWLIPRGDGEGFYRVPKPFELGYIYASVPERILDFMHQNDPETLKHALLDMLSTTGEGSFPIPTAIEPLLENTVNYDFFTNRPVVPMGLDQLAPEFQHDDRTSSVAVGIGRLTGLSPMQVDNALRGYAGSVGQIALNAIDRAARATGADDRPLSPTGRTPLVGRFVTRPDQTSDAEEAFRRRWEAAEEARRTARALAKRGDTEALERFVAERIDDIRDYDTLRDRADALQKVRDARRQVLQSREASGEAKRQALMALAALSYQIAVSGLPRDPQRLAEAP